MEMQNDKIIKCPHCGGEMKASDLVEEAQEENTPPDESKSHKDRLEIAISMLKAPKSIIQKEKQESKSGIHKEEEDFKKI